MKRKFRVTGYSFNLKKNIDKVYYEDEIFLFDGKRAELNGACMCVANRCQEIPRFKDGEFTITEV